MGVLGVPCEYRERGRAWWWRRALDEARTKCGCSAMLPCSAHVNPPMEMHGFDSQFEPATGGWCVACQAVGRVDGKATIVTDNGSMYASVCANCVRRYLGEVAS